MHGRLHEAERLACDAQAIGRLRESDYVVYGLEHAQIVHDQMAAGPHE